MIPSMLLLSCFSDSLKGKKTDIIRHPSAIHQPSIKITVLHEPRSGHGCHAMQRQGECGSLQLPFRPGPWYNFPTSSDIVISDIMPVGCKGESHNAMFPISVETRWNQHHVKITRQLTSLTSLPKWKWSRCLIWTLAFQIFQRLLKGYPRLGGQRQIGIARMTHHCQKRPRKSFDQKSSLKSYWKSWIWMYFCVLEVLAVYLNSSGWAKWMDLIDLIDGPWWLREGRKGTLNSLYTNLRYVKSIFSNPPKKDPLQPRWIWPVLRLLDAAWAFGEKSSPDPHDAPGRQLGEATVTSLTFQSESSHLEMRKL